MTARWARAVSLWATLTIAALGAPRSVSAQDDDTSVELGAEGIAQAPIPAGAALDPTAAATSIAADARPHALPRLDELLLEVPGAITRRSGGPGSISTLAIRGAGAEQTAVVLGTVPLVSPDGSAFDLSTVPLWALDRVDVYRGGAPLWLGTSAVGGVLHLIPRRAQGTGAEGGGGVGSFGLYEGHGAASVRDGSTSLLAAVGATHFSSRYPYLDDGRTALDPSDDRERERLGAEVTDASLALHLSTRIERTHLEVAGLGLERIGGLAALPARRADHPIGERRRSRYVVGLTLGWLEDDRPYAEADQSPWRVELGGSVAVERRLVRDPFAQFGLVPRDADDELLRIAGRVGAGGRIVPELMITALATVASESITLSDRLAPPVPGTGRVIGGAGAEAQLDLRAGDLRFQARGAGRIELASAVLGASDDALAILPTGRLGLALAPLPWLAIQASLATAGRMPTLLELFGDRAFLVGNPALEPEQATGGDLGLVARGRTDDRSIDGVAELRGFVQHVDRLVVYRRTEASQLVPTNVGSALSYGLEARVSGTIATVLELMGALTVLEARDGATGLRLPLRPPVSATARLGVVIDPGDPVAAIRLFADLEHVAATFSDPANLVALPERTRFGAGVALTVRDHAEVSLTIRDVFDARGVDLLGVPLPGRSIALAITIH